MNYTYNGIDKYNIVRCYTEYYNEFDRHFINVHYLNGNVVEYPYSKELIDKLDNILMTQASDRDKSMQMVVLNERLKSLHIIPEFYGALSLNSMLINLIPFHPYSEILGISIASLLAVKSINYYKERKNINAEISDILKYRYYLECIKLVKDDNVLFKINELDKYSLIELKSIKEHLLELDNNKVK